jgi:Carbohydrate-selective porin, OprB family
MRNKLFLELAVTLGLLAGTSMQVLAEEVTMPGETTVSQVNSVSELTDVDPNSWAFQALKSIVERFGCLEGYPNKTYLGNKALSRYEFAAGLNACLEKVNDLITTNTADKATKEDLATLQRLQDEFDKELASLRGRVDALETKTKDIESKLFSKTAKLDGSVVMIVQGGGASSDKTLTGNRFTSAAGTSVAGASANTTFDSRVTLNFRASSLITEGDQLRIRIRGFAGNDTSGIFGLGTGVGTLFTTGSGNPVNGSVALTFDKTYYDFSVFTPKLRIRIGPSLQGIDTIDGNSFAGADDETTFISVMHSYSPLLSGIVHSGSGAAFTYEVTDWFTLRGLYLANSGGATRAFGSGGLFGANNKGSVEAEFDIGNLGTLRLEYAHAVIQNAGASSPIFGSGTGAVLVGTNPTFASVGAASAVNAITDVYAANVEFKVFNNIGVFGRYAYGSTAVGGRGVDSDSWQGGLSFQNLLGTGNTFGVAVGQPIRIKSSPSGSDSASELDIEAFYTFKVADRLFITPDIQFITSPANVSSNSGITVGTLRASFQF